MPNIYINNRFKLNNLGLRVKDASSKMIEVHCQQGRLDGACAVYSTIMALLTLGYLNGEDLDIYSSPDKRTSKGKFLHTLLEENGLVRNGYALRNIQEEVNSKCKGISTYRFTKSQNPILAAKDAIESDKVCILRINGRHDMCHAVLAIGYEYENDDIIFPSKIFCLDPADKIHPTEYWNCILDISKHSNAEFPDYYITSNYKYNDKISIEETLIIDNANSTK